MEAKYFLKYKLHLPEHNLAFIQYKEIAKIFDTSCILLIQLKVGRYYIVVLYCTILYYIVVI